MIHKEDICRAINIIVLISSQFCDDRDAGASVGKTSDGDTVLIMPGE
jgi:hypothetical protein